VRLEPLSTRHVDDLVRAAGEDRAAYRWTPVPDGAPSTAAYVAERIAASDVMAFAQYNLTEGRYVFDMNPVGSGKDVHWITESNGQRYKAQFYTSDNLRAISER